MKRFYKKLKGIVMFTAIWLLSITASGTEYFVSPSGNNTSGNGTIGSPWKTIQKACDYAIAGDIIYLRGGTYTWRDYIDGNADGTAANPITIMNYNGESPVFDANGISISENSAVISIYNYSGANDWMSYYIFDGIEVKNSSGRGISFYKTDHLIIRNCLVHNTQTRAIGGYGTDILIDNNEIYDAAMENLNNAMGGSGWAMTCYTTTDWANGDPSENITISNNYIHNCWGEGIGPGQGSVGVLIENNVVVDVWSVGIYADKASDVIIRNNHIYNTDPTYYRFGEPANGISMANEISFINGFYLPISNFQIYNNLMVNVRRGIGFWFDSSNDEYENSYKDVYIAYNTIYNATIIGISMDDVPASGYRQPSGCVLKNNIVYRGSQQSTIGDISAWTISNNDWYGANMPTFASPTCFNSAPGFGTPALTAPPTAFQLPDATSPCYQTGTPVPSITTEDFWGTARNITTPSVGFHEGVFSIDPTINTSVSSLPAFSQTIINQSSTAQNFTASGTNLTANITVTAPAEFEISLTEGSGYGSSITLTQAGGTVSATTIYVRFSPTTTGNKSGNITLTSTGATSQNVAVSGEAIPPPSPEITTSVASLPAFPMTVTGTSSSAQSFTASGAYLTANMTITAPAEFEISLTEGSGYGTSLTLTPTGGTVANTTIYARFSPTSVGNKSGNISLTSTGATTKNVAVSGEAVLVIPPEIITSTTSLPAYPLTVTGTSSSAQSFVASGTYLTADLIITAPAEFEVSLTEGSGYGSSLALTPSAGTVTNTTIYARFSPTTTGNKSGNISLTSSGATTKNVTVSGEAVLTLPSEITVSTTTLPAFPSTVTGTSSSAQSFTASGTYLTADLVITAPAEFEVSLIEGSGYGSSLTLSPTGGTVSNTTIYARFSPTTVGSKSGNITLTSTGATTKNVAVSGTAVAPSASLVYYVDGSVSSSGDGLSWATAFKTIQEAANVSTLSGGNIIYIKPGTYTQELMVKSNGDLLLDATAGVSVTPGGVVQFPVGTDLSGINLATYPGEYYTYIARSYKSNNGVYKILSVNDAADQITVEITGDDFISESGTSGDLNMLSAAIVRPVIYKNSDPASGRVTVQGLSTTWTLVYFGNTSDGYTGTPANCNMWDGIDIMGSPHGFGLKVVCSMYNVVMNSNFYDNVGGGVKVSGRTATPATYNYFQNCDFYDDSYKAIELGASGKTQEYNVTNFNHVIDCEIYQTHAPSADFANAIDFVSLNTGCVMDGCIIRDLTLTTSYSGAITVRQTNSYALIYGNEITNISTTSGSSDFYLFYNYDDADNMMVFNNVFSSPGATVSSNFYPIRTKLLNCSSSTFAFNTITGFAKGILISNSGAGINYSSNIFDCTDVDEDWGGGGYNFNHNIFKATPSFGLGTGDMVDSPGFVSSSDFHLSSTSVARDAGAQTTPAVALDFDLLFRDVTPDIGAFEYQNPVIIANPTTLPAFDQTQVGNNSASKNFTVSGTGLNANISITAPSEFEISLTEGSGYTNTLTLIQLHGIVATTTIYVRFSPTSIGNKTANIVLSSSGATSVNVAVSGEAVGIPGLWTGSVSTEWNLAANWHNNTVPDITTDVRIPDGLSAYPVVGVSTNAVCKSLLLEGSATLEINGTLTTAQ